MRFARIGCRAVLRQTGLWRLAILRGGGAVDEARTTSISLELKTQTFEAVCHIRKVTYE